MVLFTISPASFFLTISISVKIFLICFLFLHGLINWFFVNLKVYSYMATGEREQSEILCRSHGALTDSRKGGQTTFKAHRSRGGMRPSNKMSAYKHEVWAIPMMWPAKYISHSLTRSSITHTRYTLCPACHNASLCLVGRWAQAREARKCLFATRFL